MWSICSLTASPSIGTGLLMLYVCACVVTAPQAATAVVRVSGEIMSIVTAIRGNNSSSSSRVKARAVIAEAIINNKGTVITTGTSSSSSSSIGVEVEAGAAMEVVGVEDRDRVKGMTGVKATAMRRTRQSIG